MERVFKKWIALVLFTIFITRITTLFTPLIDDEEAFATFARVILHGGLPYVSVVDKHPPLLYYWYALWLRLFGDTNMLAVHIIGMLWVFLTCLVIYRIGKKIYSGRAGLFAALAYAIFTTTYKPSYISISASLIMALPITLSVLFFLKERFFLCGIFCGLAVFTKYQSLVQLPFIIAAIFYTGIHFKTPSPLMGEGGGDGKNRIAARLAAFIAGTTVVSAAVLGFLYFQGTLSPFYEYTWKAGLSYVSTGQDGYLRRALVNIGSYVAATAILWVSLFYHVRAVLKKEAEILMLGWFIFSIPAVFVGGRFYGHYFIQLLPPLCIIAGPWLLRWWDDRRAVITALLIIFGIGFMIPRIFYRGIADHFGFHSLEVETKIAEYIKGRTEPSDKIFIWGVEPGLYFLAERFPATRFLWSDSLTGRLPGVVEAQRGGMDTGAFVEARDWKLFMDDLLNNKPSYIIDCSSGNLRDYGKFPIHSYPPISEYLAKYYTKETAIDGVDLYRRTL